jgi:hypothetical protein
MNTSYIRKMKNLFQPGRKISFPSTRKATLALWFFTLLLISCNPSPVQETTPKDPGISQRHVQEPYTLLLRTGKKEITIAEELRLVLEATAPENTAVEFPTFTASLGDFTLRDTLTLPARMTGSGDSVRVAHQVIYLLEPYLSGTYTIPAMTVTYRDRENDTEFTKLVTEEIQVTVQSLLGPDTAAAEIKDIKPPLSLPPDRAQQLMVAGLVFLLGALAIAGFFYWKKKARKKIPAAVPVRPEEIALRELERLLADNLLARGETQIFHLRISDILRRYIENRFGLKAPERTTEEFLTELSRARSENALLSSHKMLLADFLTQCDLVKFARHEPSIAESEKTYVICRDFIEETREIKELSAYDTADG